MSQVRQAFDTFQSSYWVLDNSLIVLGSRPIKFQVAAKLLEPYFDTFTQILASGGMSFPVMGTDGRGMRLLEDVGHTLTKPYPALTPLRGDHVASRQLAGMLYNSQPYHI